LVLLGIGSVVYFYCHPQLPGVCIGVLALVAGIMSVRADMHIYEKMTWIALLIAFAVFEVQAIHRGDIESTTKNQAILDGMTGGSDYLFFSPSPKDLLPTDSDEFSIQVFDTGSNTVWDAQVFIQEGEPTSTEDFAKNYHPTKIALGSVSSTYGTALGDVVIRPKRDKENVYTFRVFARNRPTIEQLMIKFDNDSNQWRFSYWIWRYLPTPQIGTELIAWQSLQPITGPLLIPGAGKPKRPTE